MSSSSILIVDSSPLMRNTVAHRLRDAGYTVHGASDTAEAMELLEGVAVDVLVLELQLRHGDGCAEPGEALRWGRLRTGSADLIWRRAFRPVRRMVPVLASRQVRPAPFDRST